MVFEAGMILVKEMISTLQIGYIGQVGLRFEMI